MRYDGNLAYEVEVQERSTRIQDNVSKRKQQTKTKAKVQTAKLHKTIGICAVLLALCAGFMISRNVAVYESKNETKELQKELNQLREYSSQKAFELDQSLDLEQIEEIATTELNMTRPEKYQIVYVNIKQDDVTEVKAKDVEGMGRVFGIFGEKK